MILVLIGVLIATADAENHAAIQTYTVVPQRLVVVAAKFVLAFAISAAIAILTTFVTFASRTFSSAEAPTCGRPKLFAFWWRSRCSRRAPPSSPYRPRSS